MALFVVRHAVAAARATWNGDDTIRPLTPLGIRQTALIDAWFDEVPDVVVASPSLRCIATVLPLANRGGTDLVLRGELMPHRPAVAAELARQLLRGRSAVVCTHGEVIPSLLDSLGVLPDNAALKTCAKGSIWQLERDEDGALRGRYWAPSALGNPLVRIAQV
jgi:8-oxo-dGTP diphosphatase